MRINPFFELYVGERLSSSEFVDIFSPFLVEHAKALFLPGNVVVKGVQGSGKSMLLSLLKSDVRMEYARAKTSFPVHGEISKFIGAGINLAHSNAIDFGYRVISSDDKETALFFADFVNYTVLLDLFRSIHTLSESSGAEIGDLHIDLSTERERTFVTALTAADIFQGTLEGCTSIDAVEDKVRERLNAYRRFLHMNDKQLDGQIRESKTDIGTPISAVVGLLKESGIIGQDVPIFIHIDQYEELANISSPKHSPDYRRIINRALARRDPALSYRIGTRGHAWRNHGFIFGVEAKLEEERDYKFVDLDVVLRRNENRKTWVFPRFVEDVFARRLRHVGLASKKETGKELLERVFGSGMAAEDKAKKYGGSNPGKSVKVDPDWPENFKNEIIALAEENPLSARLLEAWVLQQLDRSTNGRKRILPRDLSITMLSAMQGKVWWKKERIELALVQIAGRCQQRPLWSGFSEIIGLSGGSILTFLSLCQSIWDTQNQVGERGDMLTDLSGIDHEVQAVGIFKTSNYWLEKIRQETGRSSERFRLAKQIGNVLGRGLYADRRMSYPGHNGFSLADNDLDRFPHVKRILEEMSDYGTVIASSHTTKKKDRQRRQKFYLNPVLCPQFKMHYQRVKEPKYIHPTQVEKWMHDAGLPLPDSYRPQIVSMEESNLPLFGDGKDS